MKFSQRIKQNCRTAIFMYAIVFCIGLFYFVGCLGCTIMSLLEYGIEDGLESIFWYAIFLFLAWVSFCLMRFAVRKIRTCNMKSVMESLAAFGDPEELLQAVEDLPARNVSGVDLRFDDRYLAYAKRRDIRIRRMDEIGWFEDAGVGFWMEERHIYIKFSRDWGLVFTVNSTEAADQVLTELYEKSGFGKRMMSGAREFSFEPFEYNSSRNKNCFLACNGKELHISQMWSGRFVCPLEEVESCYVYYIPDGDSNDDHYLNLYLKNGEIVRITVDTVNDGLRLYWKLSNCAPHLAYRYPADPMKSCTEHRF